MQSTDIPAYTAFILPAIRAVADLGGSAKAREIREYVLEGVDGGDALLTVTRPNRPDHPVLIERIDWGRSYAKLIGALETPSRALYLLTPLGKELLALPVADAETRVRELDVAYRRSRPTRAGRPNPSSATVMSDDDHAAVVDDPAAVDNGDDESEPTGVATDYVSTFLARLHLLSPTGFEEFVLYLLRRYGLELRRVGGTGDEGIDGIGTAPISPVLSSRVAVQAKRYDPAGRPIGRETVALFQRDAQAQGAERAILVTLGRFTAAATKAATTHTPTVDLIDGPRLAELALTKETGVRLEPIVDEAWFGRFD